MKFFVNEKCIGCTLCASICPMVFSMNDRGVSEAIESEVEPAFEETAIEAMNSCPVNAIEQH